MPCGLPNGPEQFFAKVAKGAGCWTWKGRVNPRGYGRFNYGGRNVAAHRLSFELANGPIPPGMFVLHKCDVRHCVNPDHLWLGDQFDNMRDMAAKGRSGVKRGEHSHWALLSEEQVKEVLASSEAGAVLARRMGVAPTTIYAIRRGRTWKGLTRAAA